MIIYLTYDSKAKLENQIFSLFRSMTLQVSNEWNFIDLNKDPRKSGAFLSSNSSFFMNSSFASIGN